MNTNNVLLRSISLLLIGVGVAAWMFIWMNPEQEYALWPDGGAGVHEGKIGHFLGGLIWRLGLLIDAFFIIWILHRELMKKQCGIALLICISGVSAFKWQIFFALHYPGVPFIFVYPLLTFGELIGILYLARYLGYIYYSDYETVNLSKGKVVVIFLILWIIDGIWLILKDLVETYV